MNTKSFYFIFFLTIILASACHNSDADEVVEIRTPKAGSNADIIKSPISSTGIGDTAKLAKFEFDSISHDFGEIFAGAKIVRIYKFKNVGKTPLVINDARSTCGCTVPEWSKKPIMPGDTSSIVVKFDSDGKKGYQSKPVFITANTFPAENKIFLYGIVKSTLK